MSTILELKNIHKAFSGHRVHCGVNFSLDEKECLGLLGGSGTGKSVLLRSIVGLEFIDEGEIYYKKMRIDRLTEKEYQKVRLKISYSFQNGALFDSINVFENLAYPLFEHTKLSLQEVTEKVFEMLKVIKLEHAAQTMPSDLSGGMQKRVGMARSMILAPDVVLFDEPTAGLDPTNTNNVVDIISSSKKRGIASIFVTHDIPSAIKVCDRMIILKEGKIIFQGRPQEMINSTDSHVLEFLSNQGD